MVIGAVIPVAAERQRQGKQQPRRPHRWLAATRARRPGRRPAAYLYIYLSIYLSLSLYIYIYIYIYTHPHIFAFSPSLGAAGADRRANRPPGWPAGRGRLASSQPTVRLTSRPIYVFIYCYIILHYIILYHYIYTYIHTCVYIYIYMYMYMCICVCIYIYIYIYV